MNIKYVYDFDRILFAQIQSHTAHLFLAQEPLSPLLFLGATMTSYTSLEIRYDSVFDTHNDSLFLSPCATNLDLKTCGFQTFPARSRGKPRGIQVKYIDPLMLTTIANQLNIPTLTINQFD